MDNLLKNNNLDCNELNKPMSIQKRFMQGQKYERKKEFPLAKKVYCDIIESVKPGNQIISIINKVFIRYGACLIKSKQYKKAANFFLNDMHVEILDILVLYHSEDDISQQNLEEVFAYMIEKESVFEDNLYKGLGENVLNNYKSLYLKIIKTIFLLYIDKELEVAHYTQKETAELLLVKNSKLRLSTLSASNDPMEGKTFLSFININKEDYSDDSIAFCACFTFNHDSLNQFRLYGKEKEKEGTGISIVLSSDFFQYQLIYSNNKYEFRNFPLFRCVYFDKKESRVIDIGHGENEIPKELIFRLGKIQSNFNEIQEFISKNSLDSKLIFPLTKTIRYLVKDKAFKEEQECRILEIRNIFADGVSEIKYKEDKSIYIEYQEMKHYVQKIYFGPKTERIDLFREKLYCSFLKKVPCKKSQSQLF